MAVVDGHVGTRRGLIRRLEQVPGISVVGEARDAGEALAVVSDRRPDVVVTDLRRIASNGAEFLGQLGRAAPQAGIVILTTYLAEGERADLLRAGAGAVLLKEIDSGTLVRMIRRVGTRAGTGGRRSGA